jgi:dihydrofolate synthase / folylpolyglutamate synthase
MFEAAGCRVQAYTSPHLVRFNERIRLSDGLIGDALLEALFEECDRLNGGEPITFFEITTAAAFLAFSRDTAADILLLEVGLGGRLDTTNMIERAAVSIITPVSYDHMGFLGDTLEKIAFEKAGILRAGVPAVIGLQEPEALATIRAQAATVGAPLILPGTGDDVASWACAVGDAGMTLRHAGQVLHLPLPALAGVHQPQNAAVAITAALQMPNFTLGDEAIAAGLRNVVWPARLQRLKAGPLRDLLPPDAELWLDGAHNPGGTEALVETLRGWAARDGKPLYMVMGVMGTKDAAGTVRPLASLLPLRFYAVAIPGEANGLPAEALAGTARAAGMTAQPMPSVADALRAIAAEAPAQSRVIICGSLYLSGSVLAENEEPVT